MRKWKIAAAAVAVAVGLTPMIGSPAQAHNTGAYSTSFVDGAGSLKDDWGDHYSEIGNSLCNGCADSWNTDTVVMWQAILVADGLLSHSAIDGRFGPGTAAATRKWQERRSWLTADGKVGPATWGAADDRLSWSSGGGTVRYTGWGGAGTVYFLRGNSVWTSYDSGAYDLWYVKTSDGDQTQFRDSHHLYHFKRSVTVS